MHKHIVIAETAEHLNDLNISFFFKNFNAIFHIIDKQDRTELLVRFYFNFIGNTVLSLEG